MEGLMSPPEGELPSGGINEAVKLDFMQLGALEYLATEILELLPCAYIS